MTFELWSSERVALSRWQSSRVGVWNCTPDGGKRDQRLYGRKVHGTSEEPRKTAEEKAREGTGASGNNGPHEAPNGGKGRLCRP